jgi:hypothetical protein
MPKVRRVRIARLDLEHPPSRAVVDGHEPPSGAELRSTVRDGANLRPVAAAFMHEFDGTHGLNLLLRGNLGVGPESCRSGEACSYS